MRRSVATTSESAPRSAKAVLDADLFDAGDAGRSPREDPFRAALMTGTITLGVVASS
ncbi:hypothetical protein PV703_31295 [Streptomyces sp. ME01-24h]|nr:hypothetical protein [Streptomyces sp. ME19-03-3]MDX3357703.1 hypothetical protein [Streptomyces sp. ME01-24h]